ncbi:MAG: DUF1501 domain-containing protein [Verrucomicrobiota bacterium]|nr:DUF1501 domain-containing protein [Verrucomicrobiota bacterium]
MITRRSFVKTIGALGVTSGFLPLLSAKNAPDLPPGNDYKALVCIFLQGGNDSFNMLIPSDLSLYNEYADARKGGNNGDDNISVSKNALDLPDLTNSKLSYTSNPYAADDKESSGLKGVYDVGLDLSVNGIMPELAHLLRNNKVKILSNAGNLIEPLRKSDLGNSNKKKPVFLFSHNDQRRQVDIGRSDLIRGYGWAGRLADKWFDSDKYEEFPFGMNFSLRANGSRFLEGTKTRPYDLKNSARGFDYMLPNNIDSYGTGYDESYNRRSMFSFLYGGSPMDVEQFNYSKNHWNAPVSPLDLKSRNPVHAKNFLKRFYQKVGLNSLRTNDTFIEAMKEDLGFESTGAYGEELFSAPSEDFIGFDTSGRFGDFTKNLGAITKMINVAKKKGYRRQIYLVQLHGFDTHASQLNAHPPLLRELSIGLHHFNTAMQELGLSDNVVAYTTSDFGRTVSNNGDGTDHGWGAHQLVMGGGINKSEILGKLPSLALGGDSDHGNQGRIIPTIANIQIQAEIARWFGAEDDFLHELFPHLSNFQTNPDFITSSFLNLGLGA